MEARNDTGTSLAVTLTTQTVTSEIDKGRVRSESSARRLIRPPGSRVVRPPRGAPGAAPLLVRSLRGARALFSSLFNDRLNQAIANAKAASRSQDWREAIWRWRKIIDEFGDKAPPKAFLALCDGHRRRGDLDAAQAAAWEGRAKHPTNLRLAVKGAEIEIDRAEIAMARTDWRQAAKCWHTVLDVQAEADFALDGQLIAKACMGLVQGNDYDRVLGVVQDLKKRRGESKLLLALEGMVYLHSSRIEDARLHWAHYWQRARDDPEFTHQPAPETAPHGRPSRDFFPTLARSGANVAERTEDRFCVYTALFGEYDDLRSPAFVPAGVKFICFSDRDRDVAGWDVRVVDLKLDTPALENRKIKILPYDYLKDYDCSLYIDANMVFLADPIAVYHRWLKNETFVAYAHPKRSGVYEEIEATLSGLRHPPAPLLDQYVFFGDQAVPEQSGLIEATFLWRDHRNVGVRDLMEQWWDFLVRFGGHRDQPALGYLMWKTGIRPAILPNHLGTSRDNEFFCGLPHQQTAIELERANVTWRRANGGAANDIAHAAPIRTGCPPRLTWVCRDRFKAVASTLMRGYQLSEITRRRFTSTEVNYVDEHDLGAQSDSILILTKGFLAEACLDELAGLKERGNIVCADYVDDPVREELHDFLDVYVAASMTQFIHYSKRYADKLVHLITHHSDPRLKGIRGPGDYCNIGYFGEIVNARHACELQGTIDFCLTDTQQLDTNWMTKLRHYNMHYAVREPRSAKSFKPFLKGFTASQCHSNIIVPIDESDARYYLGSDYPYILRDSTLESVLQMIDYAKESFGGAEWRRGLEVMELVRQRCSATQIESEIRALLARCSD